MALRLGLDHANDLAAGIQQVINRPGLERILAHGDARRSRQIQGLVVLNGPAASSKLLVDFLARLFFRGHCLRVREWANTDCATLPELSSVARARVKVNRLAFSSPSANRRSIIASVMTPGARNARRA